MSKIKKFAIGDNQGIVPNEKDSINPSSEFDHPTKEPEKSPQSDSVFGYYGPLGYPKPQEYTSPLGYDGPLGYNTPWM